MRRFTTIPVMASLMLSPAVLAQSAADTDTGMETTTTASTFDELSRGNKMIARSLMDAQTLPDDGTTQPWSLDDIAAARSETGWGNVFKQMQAEGLVEARNLGEIVSTHARSMHRPIPESVAVEAGLPPESTAGEDAGETAMTAETPPDTDGAFESLSPGNKKIARSLMDAQHLPADGSAEPWTLDRIAAARGETGWGNVFQQMQAEGLVEARNLGQAVRQYQHQHIPAVTGTDATLATAAAAGSTSADRLPEQASGNANGHADSGLVTATAGNSNNAAGITTAAGSAGGNAHGLTKHTVSASDGVTTAGGASVGAATGTAAASSGSNNAALAAGSSSAASNSAVTASASASATAGGNANGQGFAYGRSK